VVSLLDSLPEIDTNEGKKPSKFSDAIEMKNIGFHYQMRPDNRVLDDLSLTINKGEVVALVGPSGGGKSTVVRLLMRFYDPCSGRILIDGNEMRSLNVAALHNRIGVVTQETQLFGGTILANIAYGIEDPDPNDVRRAARLANAHNFIVRFEDGYATRVGERGVRLSGGQKQRIAIARVLMRQPDILLLDEATSALDAESEALVQEALDTLISQSRSTVILVAHRLSTVKNADKIAVVDNGRIVEIGGHEQLLSKGGVYANLVSRQIANKKNTIGGDGNISLRKRARKRGKEKRSRGKEMKEIS